MSINNFVSQRGYIPASCIVDVDWLKVLVQLAVRGRDEHYRDEHFSDANCRVKHYRDEQLYRELLCVFNGTLVRGYADFLGWSGFGSW